ncbi:TPA: conjugal transfer protein [Klebsiella variicola subsp. variicola]|nr:conjugal transfer protein [Klebsiella variicola subsp. variicola]HCI4627480.1 conjugal transfer protein [Klebsiella variicola subsp. variicola]HCI6660963.1 conjugal transfer protein [Klebsiella variicola subsp. variicola]
MRHKIVGFSLIVSLTTALAMPAYAGNDTACSAIMCLAGAAVGDGETIASKDCIKPKEKFFSIVKFNRGHFDKKGTKNARSKFLKECTRDDLDGWEDKVLGKYGGQHYGF